MTMVIKVDEFEIKTGLTGLKINIKKTAASRINSKSNNPETTTGQQLNGVDKYTYLVAKPKGGGKIL